VDSGNSKRRAISFSVRPCASFFAFCRRTYAAISSSARSSSSLTEERYVIEEDIERRSDSETTEVLLNAGDVGDLVILEGIVSFCVSPLDVRDAGMLSTRAERRREGVDGVSVGFVAGRRDVERAEVTTAFDNLLLTEGVATEETLAFVRVDERELVRILDPLVVSSS
jgi:hypothetical protein